MRVFKDYKDFLENKKIGENGVTQDFLNKFYGGNINKAQADNKNNKNCFNCEYCNCFNCDYCDYCDYCDNCNRLYAKFNHSNIKEKDNE